MKNEFKGGQNITFVFCALIYIKIFTFLDHKEIVLTHDSIEIWRQIPRGV